MKFMILKTFAFEKSIRWSYKKRIVFEKSFDKAINMFKYIKIISPPTETNHDGREWHIHSQKQTIKMPKIKGQIGL